MQTQRRKALQSGDRIAHIIGNCLRYGRKSIEDVKICGDQCDLDALAFSYAAPRSMRPSRVRVRLQFVSDESSGRRLPWSCVRRRSSLRRFYFERRRRLANSNGDSGESCLRPRAFPTSRRTDATSSHTALTAIPTQSSALNRPAVVDEGTARSPQCGIRCWLILSIGLVQSQPVRSSVAAMICRVVGRPGPRSNHVRPLG